MPDISSFLNQLSIFNTLINLKPKQGCDSMSFEKILYRYNNNKLELKNIEKTYEFENGFNDFKKIIQDNKDKLIKYNKETYVKYNQFIQEIEKQLKNDANI